MMAAWSLELRAHERTGKETPLQGPARRVTVSSWHVLSGMRGHNPPCRKCPASHPHVQLPPAAATAAAAAELYDGPGAS
jgi:hypothetical protein